MRKKSSYQKNTNNQNIAVVVRCSENILVIEIVQISYDPT
jgi:hypothetical protein